MFRRDDIQPLAATHGACESRVMGCARPASRATDLAVGGDDMNVGPQCHGDLRVADCGVEREVQPPAVPTLSRYDVSIRRAPATGARQCFRPR